MALTVGDKFPALVLPVQQGTSALPAGETIDTGNSGGKWKVVFFWPKDFTFICPTEIIGYGELQRDFADEWNESLRVKSSRPLGEDEMRRLLKRGDAK